MRAAILIVAAALVVAGCNSPTTGGSMANGDEKNYPYQKPDPRRAGEANPTGSDSGPWVTEHGLNDSTTGMSDRWPTAAKPAPATLPTPITEPPSASVPERVPTRDESDTPRDDRNTTRPNAEPGAAKPH